MFCKYCGKEIRNDSKFCSSCGGNIAGKKVIENVVKSEKVSTLKKSEKSWIWLGVFAVFIIVVFLFAGKGGSIEGKWYFISEESSENPPEYEFNFMKDGKFIGDGSVGGTYGADNGELFLQYNPLAGSRSYEYVIKGGRLYLYSGQKVFVYSRIQTND